MTSRAYGARSPRSHYDPVILIVTLFATELATSTVTDERTDKIIEDIPVCVVLVHEAH